MLILYRYGEIGLKSDQVRKRFEQRLRERVHEKLKAEGVDHSLLRENNRFFVRVDENAKEKAVRTLTHVPGIVSLSIVEKTSVNLDEIFAACAPLLEGGGADTFALRVNRVGEHDFSSQEVAETVGQRIVDTYELNVNLDDPELEIFIEIRNKDAYVFPEKIDGVGGLPIDREQRVLARIEDEADVVAAYLLMRRGCTIVPFCETATDAIRGAADRLRTYDPHLKLVENVGIEEGLEVFDCAALCIGTTVEDIEDRILAEEDFTVLEPCCGFSRNEVETIYEDL